ncbi:2-oxoacid:acceptor oxidoreductase subunit alpha, partial [Staphylococcus pseudintermedius]
FARLTAPPYPVLTTPLVGPSTGLPTKPYQSDLMEMLYGTPGDIPTIVLEPTDAVVAFYLPVEAFNLAEEYQCPVILFSDFQLSLGKQTVKALDHSTIEI